VLQWDRRCLGVERFPDALSALEIEQFFGLSPDERRAVLRRRRPTNRLGVALQVGYLRMTGLPLNSVQRIPPAILAFVGRVLDQPAPQLASIRALYRRRRTLFEHQVAAQKILGLRAMPEHAERALIAFLRRSAGEHFKLDTLADAARARLIEHGYLQPTGRRLRKLVVAARRHHEAGIAARVDTLVDAPQREGWLDALLAATDAGKTKMEWLREGPASKKPMGVADQFARIAFLKERGAAALDLGIPLALLQRLARPMLYRKPAALARMRPARRTLEIACFLRLQLLRPAEAARRLGISRASIYRALGPDDGKVIGPTNADLLSEGMSATLLPEERGRG